MKRPGRERILVRTPPFLRGLKLEPQHELQLPRQARARVRRRLVVVVVVEVDRRSDDPKVAGVGQVARSWCRRVIEAESVRIAELDVIEDIEELNAELQRKALGKFRFFHQRHVDLPRVQCPDDAVARSAKVSEKSRHRIKRRSLECGNVDDGNIIVTAAGNSQRHSRDEIRTLVGLIIAVGKKEGGVPMQIHRDGIGMTRMPYSKATQLPTTHNLARDT